MADAYFNVFIELLACNASTTTYTDEDTQHIINFSQLVSLTKLTSFCWFFGDRKS